jgi:hypothetical protein
MPLAEFSDEWTLYCSCARPAASSQWRRDELKICAVSNRARDRGFGTPEDIVEIVGESNPSRYVRPKRASAADSEFGLESETE